MDETRENQPEQNDVTEQISGNTETNKDARMWAMLCHLAALSGYVSGLGFIVGPLVIWLIKKNEFSFVNEHGKEAVNFQISMFIYAIIAALLIMACIGIVLLPLVGVVDLIFLIIASMKANNGESYRYPLTIRFIK